MLSKILIAFVTQDNSIFYIDGDDLLQIQKEYDLNMNHQEITGFLQFASEWLRKEYGETISLVRFDAEKSRGLKEYNALKREWEEKLAYKRERDKRWIDQINKVNKKKFGKKSFFGFAG